MYVRGSSSTSRTLSFIPRPNERQIQRVLNREHEIAKQNLVNGHKDRALIALRRRKYQETLLAKTDAQLEQLEQLVRPLPSYPLPRLPTLGLCTGFDHRVLSCGDVGATRAQGWERSLEADQ